MTNDYEDDEELEIDFGKITNIFKGKKKKPDSAKEELKKAEDEFDELSKEVKEKGTDSDKKKIEDIKEDLSEEKERVSVIEEEKKDVEKEDFSEEKRIEKIEKKMDKVHDEIDDDSFDFSSVDVKKSVKDIKGFFSNNKWVIPVLLLLIVIGFSTWFRAYPTYLPITDEWAENNVDAMIKQQVAGEVNAQYPNLPQANKDTMINKRLAEFKEQNKEQIEQSIKASSVGLKSRLQYEGTDGEQHTYLLAIDPYLWYGQIRNYVENGHFGDTLKDGESWYSLRNGRLGKKPDYTSAVNIYFGAFLYKAVSIFDSDADLMAVYFLVPLILIGLSVIPAFFIGKRISGNLGGFFAGMIVAVNFALLGRTPAGFADTDAYNIFFPLMIMWVFLEAFEAKEVKWKTIYAGIAGVLVGLYSKTWLGGWWYAFDFVLAALLLYLGYQAFLYFIEKADKKAAKSKLKTNLITGGVFFAVSMIFVYLMQGVRAIMQIVQMPLNVINLKDVAVTSYWPNVLTTVAEFNTVPLSGIVSQMGGSLLFWLGLMGIVALLFNRKNPDKNNWMYLVGSAVYYAIMVSMKSSLNQPMVFMVIMAIPILVGLAKIVYLKEHDEIDIKAALLIMIWFLGTAYGFTKGIRFSILMVPAFAVAFGVCIGMIYQYASKWVSKELKIDETVTKVVAVLLLLLLLGAPIKAADKTAMNEIPSMNDAWYDSLTAIKHDSEDAIITSWWDFGHWFAAISQRRVTFDGADQGRRIHWVGKSLQVDDEKQAMGILRMLNCGQITASNYLEEKLGGDTPKAMDIINEIIVLDRESALEVLEKEGLDREVIDELIEKTHCEDLIDQYYIASEDMIGKAGVWAHFGTWDFHKAKMWQTIRKGKMDYSEGLKVLQEEFGLDEETADKYYYEITTTDADKWVSGWPGYMTGKSGCVVEEGVATCVANVQGNKVPIYVNLTTMDAHIPGKDDKKAYPNSIVYVDGTSVKEKEFEGDKIGFSVILIPNNGEYQIVLSSPQLANSMFTRMFYYEGHGLEYFEPFVEKQQINGGMIYVYKVNWEKGDVHDAYEKPPQEEIKASHILIPFEGAVRSTTNRSEEDALELVNQIAEMINETNFADIAMEYSEGPSASRGGDLGWFSKEAMVKEFSDAAFALEEGEIAYPVKTPFGYHIIKLFDRREVEQESGAPSIDDVEEVREEELDESHTTEEDLGSVNGTKEVEIEI